MTDIKLQKENRKHADLVSTFIFIVASTKIKLKQKVLNWKQKIVKSKKERKRDLNGSYKNRRDLDPASTFISEFIVKIKPYVTLEEYHEIMKEIFKRNFY